MLLFLFFFLLFRLEQFDFIYLFIYLFIPFFSVFFGVLVAEDVGRRLGYFVDEVFQLGESVDLRLDLISSLWTVELELCFDLVFEEAVLVHEFWVHDA